MIRFLFGSLVGSGKFYRDTTKILPPLPLPHQQYKRTISNQVLWFYKYYSSKYALF